MRSTNGNGRLHSLSSDTLHDSDDNISRFSASPDFVSVDIPPPQLQPKAGFKSILNFWSDMEQTSRRSASIASPRFSSGSISEADSTSTSISSKPSDERLQEALNCSVSYVRSEQLFDVHNLSAKSKILTPSGAITNPNAIKFQSLRLPNGERYNRSKAVNHEPLLVSPPALPPKSLTLPKAELDKSNQTDPVNGYRDEPTSRENDDHARSLVRSELLHYANNNIARASDQTSRARTQTRPLQMRPASAMNGSTANGSSAMDRNGAPANVRGTSSFNYSFPAAHQPSRNAKTLPKESIGAEVCINGSISPYPNWGQTRQSVEIKHTNSNELAFNTSRVTGGGSDVGVTMEPLSVISNTSDEGLVTVRLQLDVHGQYGFSVRGGADYKQPVTVTQVGDNMPASTASPRLHVGDQIIRINDRNIAEFTQDQVISCIQKCAKDHAAYLGLVVKSNANYLEENAVDSQFADTGKTPPRPPKTTLPVTRKSPSFSQKLDACPFYYDDYRLHQPYQNQQEYQLASPAPPPPPKPRFGSSGIASAKFSSRLSITKGLISDTEAPSYVSMQDIEIGLADGSLVLQFEKLERGNPEATMHDAKASRNISKNRYRDISPYDHSRVRIDGVDGDYINASFVKMKIPPSNSRKYIASQGPLPMTCADFWQMCWEQRSELIVMLTSEKEQGRVKCHKYWPDLRQTREFAWTHPKSSSSSSFGKCIQLRISNIQEEVNAGMAYREFQMQRIVTPVKDDSDDNLTTNPIQQRITNFARKKAPPIASGVEVRRVIQLQFANWPDHGVPSDCADLVAFVERIRSLRDQAESSCLVVHCSAGIGRTGVLILLDTAMDMIKAHSPVHPIEMVRQIRKYREMLVQTSAQFQFACKAIIQYYYDTVLRQSQTKKS